MAFGRSNMCRTDLWAVRAPFAPFNVGFMRVCCDDAEMVYHLMGFERVNRKPCYFRFIYDFIAVVLGGAVRSTASTNLLFQKQFILIEVMAINAIAMNEMT